MKQKVRLSDAQKRIIQLIREHGYLLVWNKEHFFFEFEKTGRSVSKYTATTSAKSLIEKGLLEENTDTEIRTTYRLSELGKTIDL